MELTLEQLKLIQTALWIYANKTCDVGVGKECQDLALQIDFEIDYLMVLQPEK